MKTTHDDAVYLCRRLMWNALTRILNGQECEPRLVEEALQPHADDVELVERFLRQRECVQMGDRANVFVKEDASGEGVFLYTHWGGSGLPELVQEVLSLRERWNDPSYLARMIFSRMIKGEESGTTGYGISQRVGDGDDRVIKVDAVKQEVTIGGKTWGFEQFLKVQRPEWREGG